jgi:hypothetical protein
MTAQMPLWLVDQLDADGVMDKATRLTHKPKPRRCPKCLAPTLGAINDLGLPTHLDPAPLTNAGELLAQITGRATYALDSGEIYQRGPWHIRGRPADAEWVYAEHACGKPLPSKQLPPRTPSPTDPPF